MGGPGATLNILGCVQARPQCGTQSEIFPGTYKAGFDGNLNVLIDPSISLKALGAIRKLAERAKAGEISAQQAKREAEKIHLNAGKLFDIANGQIKPRRRSMGQSSALWLSSRLAG
jgi:hypothetical protein